MTQLDVASLLTDALRLNDPTASRVWPRRISEIENRKAKPSADEFLGLVFVLKCSVADLTANAGPVGV